MVQSRVLLALLLGAMLSTCGPRGDAYGPVTTKDRALEIAKVEFGAPLDDRPVAVELEAGTWVVTFGPTANGSVTTYSIDATSGRVTSYSDEVTDVAIIKPAR